MIAAVLVTVFVLCGTRPVPHALFACDGVMVYGSDDGEGVDGAMQADSRGAVVFDGPAGAYTCRAWKDRVGFWLGILHIDTQHRRFTLQLKEAF